MEFAGSLQKYNILNPKVIYRHLTVLMNLNISYLARMDRLVLTWANAKWVVA